MYYAKRGKINDKYISKRQLKIIFELFKMDSPVGNLKQTLVYQKKIKNKIVSIFILFNDIIAYFRLILIVLKMEI